MEQNGLLNSCVHCGLCLQDCPTYKLTGDEGNSPRGRLLLWKAEEEGRIHADKWSDFYTDECIGCLACESACPSNVPYGDLLHKKRKELYQEQRSRVNWKVALSGRLIMYPGLFDKLMMPVRSLRRLTALNLGGFFAGAPTVFQSSREYAEKLVEKHKPTGPRVALLTGCLMEGVFREINFATIRVLVANNIHVVVPSHQGCCGALYEHTGMGGADALASKNREAFGSVDCDLVVTNSAGCGLSLSTVLKSNDIAVQDVLSFLGEVGVKSLPKQNVKTKLYVDLPCHLVHGQKVSGIPESVLDATGYSWEMAPGARDCCGSGGTYHIQKPENAQKIIREKSTFLNQIPPDVTPVLATSNHVCMMQWNLARKYVSRSFQVKHVIQLLDQEID